MSCAMYSILEYYGSPKSTCIKMLLLLFIAILTGCDGKHVIEWRMSSAIRFNFCLFLINRVIHFGEVTSLKLVVIFIMFNKLESTAT